MMNNKLDSLHIIDSSKLKSEKYFGSLMNEAINCGLIGEDDVSRISFELFALLSEICSTVAQKGTSSMKIEDAEDISNSIMYCVSVRLKECVSPEEALKLLEKNKIEEVYYQGLLKIDSMLKAARMHYTILKKNLLKTKNEYFNSAVNEEMKAFFASYNSKTAADKRTADFDYPIYNSISNLVGAEYGCEYIQSFLFENDFCLNFESENVHRLLLALDEQANGLEIGQGKEIYQKMPINIYSYVLAAALGLVLCSKNPLLLNLDSFDISRLEKTFYKKDYSFIQKLLSEAAKSLSNELCLSENASKYVFESVSKLSKEISLNSENNIKGIFLSLT